VPNRQKIDGSKIPRALSTLEMVCAKTAEDVKRARALFEEYADSLGFDLRFQDFAKELASLPGDYAPPGGLLLLATDRGRLVGCVALRRLTDTVCEMKRLYVRPPYRRLGMGRGLVEAIIGKARGIGYTRMRLDTVPSMKEARTLYRSIGFKEIPPYCHNPIEGATFMELVLG